MTADWADERKLRLSYMNADWSLNLYIFIVGIRQYVHPKMLHV